VEHDHVDGHAMLDEDATPQFPISRRYLRGPGPHVICKRGTQADLLICILRGKVTLEIVVEALEEALDLGLSELAFWNAMDGDLSGLSPSNLRDLAAHVFAGPWAPRRLAILAASIPSLAAAGAFEMFAAEHGAQDRVMVFDDRESALDWLGITEPHTSPALPRF